MKKSILKSVSVFIAINLLAQIAAPTVAFALSGGPSQPEVESFEPVATTNMVDLFSGDFNYNIPLFDVGGYPINIAYHSGVGMDQEASWVGLGWNLNVGAINRNVRGVPDDFKGDQITEENHYLEEKTWSVFAGLSNEAVGLDKDENKIFASKKYKEISADTSKKSMKEPKKKDAKPEDKDKAKSEKKESEYKMEFGLGVTYNNYRGYGLNFSASVTTPSNLSIGIGGNSQGGMDIDVGYAKYNKDSKKKYSVGIGMNSKYGLSMRADINYNKGKKAKLINKLLHSANFSFNTVNQFGLGPVKLNTREVVQNYGIKIGFSTQATFGTGILRGSLSNNGIEPGKKKQSRQAYGYMYTQDATPEESLMDFGKERESSFKRETQNLPITYHAFDIINATGQGTAGTFRPYRDNLGMYTDPASTHKINHLGVVSGEVGIGTGVVEVGITYSPSVGGEQTGHWPNSGAMKNKAGDFHFKHNVNNRTAEPFYFKAAGELTPVNSYKYNELGGDRAVMQELDELEDVTGALTTTLIDGPFKNSTRVGTLRENYAGEQRTPRAQYISFYSAQDAASRMGIMEKLRSYFPGAYSESNSAYTEITRIGGTSAKNHHIGEIVQTNPDGARYIYAIPAYNNTRIEAQFNTDGGADVVKGLVGYAPNYSSMNNDKGVDHFYNKTITPGYAHSYLLTAVLSPNYVDSDGDGKPSDGDLGDYVLFNYSRIHEAFRWRVPIEENTGQFQEGLRSEPLDNQALYSYGTKEIWYLHSIVTRNYVAEFKTSKRLDALGVKGEHGGADVSQYVYKLDEVNLYAKNDRLINGSNATPVKTVVFEYDYSLCGNVPNHTNANTPFNNGKLTLKKVYFTYGNSKKGAETPYHFQYGYNPNYNLANYDRWGNYKPNSDLINNKDFPYVRQNIPLDSNHAYAAAWSLKKIILPSGGNIDIQYEADDYAYVQDKKAMQMVTLVGATDEGGINNFSNVSKDILYDSRKEVNDYLVFRLPAGVSTAQQLKERCFDGLEYLYFKALVNIRGKEEYVSGWSKIDHNKIGIIAGDPSYGYVRVLPPVDENAGKNMHPISLAAFQMALIKMNKIINPGSEPKHSGRSALTGLANSLLSVVDMFRSPYKKLRALKVARLFKPNESWIRINNANGFKIGGGVRVKKISFSDGWNKMDATDNEMVFDQEFDYTTEENNRIISSGVAAYEPLVGGEENPFRKPIFTSVNRDLVRAELSEYMEEPYGETFYPGASVGYSKVTVTSNRSKTNAKNGTGYTVNQYYTAKDYPVKVNITPIKKSLVGQNPLSSKLTSLLKMFTYERTIGSQGYSIVVNDMHGKPKSIDVFGSINGQTSPKISSVKYIYKTESNGELSSTVPVLNENGTIQNQLVGKEIDCSLYASSSYSNKVNVKLPINIKFSLPGIGFAFLWPGFVYERSVSKFASVTKLIQVNGILEKTIVEDENSMIATSNVLYDKYTGGVLLTQTTNNFDDPIFNFNYPAYLAYGNMGAAYKNQDVEFDLTTIASGSSVDEFPKNFFTTGDLLYLNPVGSGTAIKAWVNLVVPIAYSDNIKITVINHHGQPVSGQFKGRIIQSGRKNMLNSSVGGLVLSASPIQNNSIQIPTNEVIQATAVNYQQRWPMSPIARIGTSYEVCDTTVQPFILQTVEYLNVLLTQNLNGNNAIKFRLNQVPGYANSPIIDRIRSLSSGCEIYNCSATHDYFAFRTTGELPPLNQDTISNWQSLNNDTVRVYHTNPLRTSIAVSNFTLSSIGCKLIDVDRFLVPTRNTVSPCGIVDVKAVMKNNDTCNFVLTQQGTIYDQCFIAFVNCKTFNSCVFQTGVEFNPYITGDKNLWLPQNEYAFNEERVYPFKGDTTFVRRDGKIKNFVPYWDFTWWGITPSGNKKWIAANTITRYNKRLQPVEQVDALNNFSAELYGYNHSLVTATANYSRINEMASDNFEEYVTINPSCNINNHWNFNNASLYQLSNYNYTPIEQDNWNVTKPIITNKYSHTGQQSLCIPAKYAAGVKTFTDSLVVIRGGHSINAPYHESSVVSKQQIFSPFNNRKYVVSAWVMGRAVDRTLVNSYDSAYIRVVVTGTNESKLLDVVLKPAGPIIDGWQRVEGVITIPAQGQYIEVLAENIGRYRAYFDDIRIHPFDGSMRTFVYDPIHLKVMAILDENNFASFYEYDNEGKLIRIKKETEKGVFTIKESRNGIRKPLMP